MKISFKVIILFILSGFLQRAQAQETELKYDNYIYDADIKSVILGTNGTTYNPFPVANLGATNALKLQFDKMDAENEFFQYKYVHCDANWNPSQLQVTEYLEGDQMGEIRNFNFSTNTFEQYVQYELIFPKPEMKPLKSGNYLLMVFRNFNEEELILTRRFMILDSRTRCSGEVKGATNPKLRFVSQEVDFEVNYENYNIPNPFTDVKAVVMQNNNWVTAKYNLKPLFVNNNTLQFNYEDVNVFDATNEFRVFDTRSLRFFSQNASDKFTDSLVHVVLRKEEIKSHLAYSFQKDFNGKRLIVNTDGSGLENDIDYAMIHFVLKSDNKLRVGDVYLYGEFTDWQVKPEFKMTYHEQEGVYTNDLKLKQGYYNYHYVVASEPWTKPEYSFTEGNHFETENDYTVLLYHYNMYYNFDELVGMITLNSSQQR
jgi:hypothetical protein